MGDRSVMYPTMVAQEILKQALNDQQVADEIYCQIMKQIDKNPNATSSEKGWELLELCLVTFSPGPQLVKFVGKFLQTAGRRQCLAKLTAINSAVATDTTVPSLEKVHQLRRHVTNTKGKKAGKVKAGWLCKKATIGWGKRQWYVLDTGEGKLLVFKEQISSEAPKECYELIDLQSVHIKKEKANARQ